MKKLLLGITILAFILMGSHAMAAGPKVPKSLCLDWVSYGDTHQLAMKSIGSVPTSGGVVKMYTISGYVYGIASHPVNGSGYVAPGTTILHATYSGQGAYLGNTFRTFELFFNLGTNSGTLSYRYLYGDGTEYSSPSATNVVSTDCSSLSIPAMTTIASDEKFSGQ